MDQFARLADLVVGDESGEGTGFGAFGYGASGAFAEGVGVVVRDRLALDAGIEPEHPPGVALQGLIAATPT